MKHFCEQRANEKQQRLDSWRGCLYINHLSYPRILTFFIEWLRFYFWSHDWWKPRIPEVKTKNTSWIIIIHQSPLWVQILEADIANFGECVQAPLTRHFVPNICSVLAPPGACSQASWREHLVLAVHLQIFSKFRCVKGDLTFYVQMGMVASIISALIHMYLNTMWTVLHVNPVILVIPHTFNSKVSIVCERVTGSCQCLNKETFRDLPLSW